MFIAFVVVLSMCPLSTIGAFLFLTSAKMNGPKVPIILLAALNCALFLSTVVPLVLGGLRSSPAI